MVILNWRCGAGTQGGEENPHCATPPTPLCVFYHTYLSVAVVGGVDVVIVDEEAYNMVICVLYGIYRLDMKHRERD